MQPNTYVDWGEDSKIFLEKEHFSIKEMRQEGSYTQVPLWKSKDGLFKTQPKI